MEAEVTRVLVGLDEYVVLDAVDATGELVVSVAVPRPEAACPRCGVFSGRVKQYVAQRVRDGVSFARLTTLVWIKRRFRCDTPGCRANVHRVDRPGAPSRSTHRAAADRDRAGGADPQRGRGGSRASGVVVDGVAGHGGRRDEAR